MVLCFTRDGSLSIRVSIDQMNVKVERESDLYVIYTTEEERKRKNQKIYRAEKNLMTRNREKIGNPNHN